MKLFVSKNRYELCNYNSAKGILNWLTKDSIFAKQQILEGKDLSGSYEVEYEDKFYTINDHIHDDFITQHERYELLLQCVENGNLIVEETLDSYKEV